MNHQTHPCDYVDAMLPTWLKEAFFKDATVNMAINTALHEVDPSVESVLTTVARALYEEKVKLMQNALDLAIRNPRPPILTRP